MLRAAGQGRGKLDHRVAAVVGAADQAGVEQRVRQEAAQQPLRLGVAERLLGVLVLDQLDAVEVAVAPTSPTIGRSQFLRVARNVASLARTFPQVLLLEHVRLASATAEEIGV
jgi:hypothetical protein